jgi:hypothetical protein
VQGQCGSSSLHKHFICSLHSRLREVSVHSSAR